MKKLIAISKKSKRHFLFSWILKAKTLVWHWYAGMEGGTALAEVLFGKVNPSGKLPETFLVTADDCSAHCVGEFPGDETADYAEGIFVGYRYYDTYGKKVLFPFGYGLSYTEFSYENLQVVESDRRCDVNDEIADNVGEHENKKASAEEKIIVSLDITNIGIVLGKEIVQIYAGKKDSVVERASKELRGFAKVELNPGETKNVEIELDARTFQYYNEEKGCFVTEYGIYEIYAGKSVSEICCETKYKLEERK